ncbi:Fur family transcriptional regulator [Nitratidesulfovibrio sp. SRB-5]|uniref:Fur family transcriptional regulator n=1 Tax=Nitratidesulfovibrio sp. SRB-5 TaxID=2872636 RepID=UPI0010250846|nr:transcriptional repressor [Nitratidesulfovibrio sp. SRB-5]MBZ2172562.1 transcriptional repressor [Nitratidesulfovibrio sp. SRB-5]RXF77086.1 transcriptional repressor [Desulfovibrio sp. DS-1]
MDTRTRLASLLERLRDNGHRLTPQRVAIVRALIEHDGHPTVEQLHQSILPDFPTTSLATVYKTIALLKEDGEVLELGFGELGSRYDGRHPEPHPHLICTRCGAIADYSLQELDELVARMAAATGFAVTSHRFDMFGLCPACRGAAHPANTDTQPDTPADTPPLRG